MKSSEYKYRVSHKGRNSRDIYNQTNTLDYIIIKGKKIAFAMVYKGLT